MGRRAASAPTALKAQSRDRRVEKREYLVLGATGLFVPYLDERAVRAMLLGEPLAPG